MALGVCVRVCVRACVQQCSYITVSNKIPFNFKDKAKWRLISIAAYIHVHTYVNERRVGYLFHWFCVITMSADLVASGRRVELYTVCRLELY